MTYELCKYKILNNDYDKEEMKADLALFKLTKYITAEQFIELNNLIEPEGVEENGENTETDK